MHRENTYPLISVVVPAYNAETRIAGTLEAILAQDYPNLEVIVVNDASKDKTEQAARRVLESCGRPFSVIRKKKNRGVSAAAGTTRTPVSGPPVFERERTLCKDKESGRLFPFEAGIDCDFWLYVFDFVTQF